MKKVIYVSTIALALLGTAGIAKSAQADEITDKAQLVIQGKFGNGQDRKLHLGKNYDQIQAKVNEILGRSSSLPVSSVKVATERKVSSVTTLDKFSVATVSARTQYSHTTTRHAQGAYYTIPSSVSVTTSGSGKIIRGAVTRSGIGLEKGVITLAYTLHFDSNGNYVSGTVTSSGYVTPSITLKAGQNYLGKYVTFLSTTSGYAGSGSYVYPITAVLNLG